jgi:outer membrane autotransporter protein
MFRFMSLKKTAVPVACAVHALFWSYAATAGDDILPPLISGVQTVSSGDTAKPDPSGTGLDSGSGSAGTLIISNGATLDPDGKTITVNGDVSNAFGGAIVFEAGSQYPASTSGGITLRMNGTPPGDDWDYWFDFDQLYAGNVPDYSNAYAYAAPKIWSKGVMANASELLSDITFSGGEVLFNINEDTEYTGNFQANASSGNGRLAFLVDQGRTFTLSGDVNFNSPYGTGYFFVWTMDGAAVSINGDVGARFMIIDGRGKTAINGNVNVSGTMMFYSGTRDTATSGISRRFGDSATDTVTVGGSLLIESGDTEFMGPVYLTGTSMNPGERLQIYNATSYDLTRFADQPITRFRSTLTTADIDFIAWEGETHLEGAVNSFGTGNISIGINPADFADGSPWAIGAIADFGSVEKMNAHRRLYLLGSKAELFLDSAGMSLVASNVQVQRHGRLILTRNAALTGNLDVAAAGPIDIAGFKTASSVPGGTVDLGLSALTVSGNATFGQGSELRVSHNLTSTGKITVSGTATIGDSVKVVFAEEATGKKPVEVNSGNRVLFTAGSFADDTVFVSNTYTLVKSGNDIVLGEIIKGGGNSPGGVYIMPSEAYSALGSNGNIVAGIALIGSIVDEDALPGSAKEQLQQRILGAVHAAVDGLGDDPAALGLAIAQLAGSEALSTANAAAETSNLVVSAIGTRFAAIHSYESFPPSAGYADSLNRLWVSGYGNWSRQRDHGGTGGYRYDTKGVVIGYDREFSAVEDLTVGLATAWTDGKLKNNDGRASTDVKTISLNLYGNYKFENGMFIDALIGYGHSENDADIFQIIGGARKTASFDTETFQAAFDLGYFIRLSDQFNLAPSIGLHYLSVRQDGWTEQIAADPANLAVANWFGGVSRSYLDIPVEFTLSGELQAGSVTIYPKVKTGVIFTANRPDNDMAFGFAGSGKSAVIHGIAPSRTRFQGGVSLGIQATEVLDLFLDYDIEARNGYQSHSGMLGAGFRSDRPCAAPLSRAEEPAGRGSFREPP